MKTELLKYKKSRCMGVHKRPDTKKSYRAVYRNKHIGYFRTEAEAVTAYKEAKEIHQNKV